MSIRRNSLYTVIRNMKNRITLSFPSKRAVFQIPSFSVLSKEGIPFTISLYMECEIPIHLYFLRSKRKLSELREFLKARILEECAVKPALKLEDINGTKTSITKVLKEHSTQYQMSFLDISDFKSTRHIQNDFNKLLEIKEALAEKERIHFLEIELIKKEKDLRLNYHKRLLASSMQRELMEEHIIKDLIERTQELNSQDLNFLLKNQIIQHFSELNSINSLESEFQNPIKQENSRKSFSDEDYKEIIKKSIFYDNEILYSTEEEEEARSK